MTTTAPWLGINPAECLKDSDTRQTEGAVRLLPKPVEHASTKSASASPATAGCIGTRSR